MGFYANLQPLDYLSSFGFPDACHCCALPPVHGILRVLKQIGGFFVLQSIHSYHHTYFGADRGNYARRTMSREVMMESVWSKTCTISPRPALNGDAETEVAVIGAGMAGILTAAALGLALSRLVSSPVKQPV